MGLTVKEIEELCDDIKMHLDLDKAKPGHIQYWEALLGLCDWELAEARKKDALDRARVRGEEPPAELLAEERGLHSRIKTDARNLLKGKTYGELEAMQSHFESMLCSGTAKVVEYWEAVLKHLHVYKAKACLKEIRLKKVHEYLLWLEQRLDDEDKEEQEVKLDTNHSLQLKEEEEKDVKQDIEDAQTYSRDL